MPAEKITQGQRPADLLRDAATQDSAQVLERLHTTSAGLTEEEAAERLEVYGPNEVGQGAKT